ncbi:MAG: Calx-beta domain-containing protein [Panacagrimonas sp.]
MSSHTPPSRSTSLIGRKHRGSAAWRSALSGIVAAAALTWSLGVEAQDVTGSELWTDVTESAARSASGGSAARDHIHPRGARLVRLGGNALDAMLSAAPKNSGDASRGASILSLPRPDGGFERFQVWEDPVMAPALQAWMAQQGFPMRTFAGVSLDRPGMGLRFDWGGPRGFHASVLGPEGAYYVDPRWRDDADHYASYGRAQLSPRAKPFQCLTEGAEPRAHRLTSTGPVASLAESTGGARRVYRLAVAATGEYTAFHGGTKALAQAAIVTSVNRVNQLFLRDTSVFMQLIGNNQNIVYTNASGDPYDNDDGVAMLSQNQTNITSVIGSTNYDIGHVFSTGGGGVANLEVPCNNGAKARGVTGQSAPVGDAFDIDFVAHEIGHQFGGLHTFNSTTGACGGNRESVAAFEPGSGTTIMAYAGICSSDNVQSNSDDFFHYRSIEEILNFTAGSGVFSGDGNSCSTKVTGVNGGEPTVNAGPNFTIPARTPFELTATGGSDSDGNANLTYLWEQYDLGPARTLAAGDGGSGPIIRSFPASTSPTRSVPRLSTVLGQTAAAAGEILPTTSRTLTFRVTLRDNDADGGRIGTDTMTLTTVNTGAAFAVTSPNGGETVNGTAVVTWNVAGSSGGAINASNVDILFSADNGQTYQPVLTATPNDGSQQITLPPDTSTSTARIKIKSSNNIFYDVSNGVFSASSDGGGGGAPALSVGNASVTEGNAGSVSATFTVTLSQAASDPVTVDFATSDGTATSGSSDYVGRSGSLSFAAGETSKTFTVTVNGDTLVEQNETFTVTLSNPGGATIADGNGTGTIQNDDSGSSLPAITIGDVSVTEGRSGRNTPARFTVRLSRSSTQTVTVRFATANGSARAPGDYTSKTGTVSFSPGSTSRTVEITVKGDSSKESNENFFVNLNNPTRATLSDAQGVGTIRNDD